MTTPASPNTDPLVASGYENPATFTSVEYQAKSSKQAMAKAPVHPVLEIPKPEVCQIPKSPKPVAAENPAAKHAASTANMARPATTMGRPLAQSPEARSSHAQNPQAQRPAETQGSLAEPDAVKIIGDAGGERTVSLAIGVTSIGGGPKCAIRLESPCRPMHCVITRNEDKTTVRRWAADTLLNGRSFTEAPLHIGDQLTIADVELLLVTEQGSQSLTDIPEVAPKPASDAGSLSTHSASQGIEPSPSDPEPTPVTTLDEPTPTSSKHAPEAAVPESVLYDDAPKVGAACKLPSVVPAYLLKPWEDAQVNTPIKTLDHTPAATFESAEAMPAPTPAQSLASQPVVTPVATSTQAPVVEVETPQEAAAESTTIEAASALKATLITTLADTRRRARSVIKGLRTERHQNAIAKQHAEEQAEQLESTCEWLRSELDNTLVKLDENKQLTVALQAELADKKTELHAAEDKLAELAQQLAEETSARQSLEAQVDELLVQASELLEAQQESLAEREALQSTVDRLQLQFQEIAAQIEQLQAEKAELANVASKAVASATLEETASEKPSTATDFIKTDLPSAGESHVSSGSASSSEADTEDADTEDTEASVLESQPGEHLPKAQQPLAQDKASEVVDVNPWLAMTETPTDPKPVDEPEASSEEPETQEISEVDKLEDEPIAAASDNASSDLWAIPTPVETEEAKASKSNESEPIPEFDRSAESVAKASDNDQEAQFPASSGDVWDIEKASGAFWSTAEEESPAAAASKADAAPSPVAAPTPTAWETPTSSSAPKTERPLSEESSNADTTPATSTLDDELDEEDDPFGISASMMAKNAVKAPDEEEQETEVREVELPETDQADAPATSSASASPAATNYSDLWTTPSGKSATTEATPESSAAQATAADTQQAAQEVIAPSESTSANAWLESFSASLADKEETKSTEDSASLNELDVPQVAEAGGGAGTAIDESAFDTPEPEASEAIVEAATPEPEVEPNDLFTSTLSTPEASASENPVPENPAAETESPSQVSLTATQEASEPTPEEPAKSGEPTSFLERYAHLLPADDEEPTTSEGFPQAAAAVSPPASQPVPTPAAPTPAPVSNESSEEDSIDDYMAKLMQRVRGEDTPEEDSTSATQAPETTEVETPAIAQSAAPMPEPTAPVKPLESLEELRGGRAPEQARDMSALRALANDTARNAIGVAAKKSGREKTFAHLAASGIMVAVGAYLAASSTGLLSKQLGLGLALLVVSGYWLTRSLAYFRKEKSAGEARASQSLGLPIDRV